MTYPSPGYPRSGWRGEGWAAVLLVLLALLLAGCPQQDAGEAPAAPPRDVDRSAGAFTETDPWILTTTDRNAARGNHGIFLGNGRLGATFGPDGGAGPDSVCYVAGVYTDEERIAPAPRWNRLELPAELTAGPYAQTLDMKRGILVTKMGRVTVTAFVSPGYGVIHVEGAPLPPLPALETPGAWVRVPLPAADAERRSLYELRDRSDPLALSVEQEPAPFDKGWTRSIRLLPRSALKSAEPVRFDYLRELERHTTLWAQRWKSDIIIEGDPEAQQLVHSLMFNLLSSVRPGAADSIPPETWAGDFYKGHIFWDAEVWMFPALLAQHPDLARSVLDYRYNRLPEARRRARAAGYAGADFPWESAQSGRETVGGAFSKGRHVTAGVGWAHWQYWLATQDKVWLAQRGWPVLSAVADFWASRAKQNPQTGTFDVRDVTGPDENRGAVDNNTYTNALARYCLRAAGEAAKVLGKPANPRWAGVAKRITLPFDKANHRYLARAGDEGEKTKQADGELLLYPARLPMDDRTARATFDFHAERPIKNGPAMTASIHALIAARLGRAQEAERSFRDAYRPFVRGPFLQFSEKRSLDRCYFATGAGGVLQSVLYGFGGLDWDAWDENKMPVIKPTLPPGWKKLTITGIRRGPATYTLTATPDGGTLRPQKGP
uniref:GH65 / GH95 n=1 Tax=uncultured Armatimonadetes bacterium TaxID=157466 RepID=A0A6J4IH56_9BACT|nr:GH65 / GH95 [uncultured Armatimonadetes bacterium]